MDPAAHVSHESFPDDPAGEVDPAGQSEQEVRLTSKLPALHFVH